MSLAILTLPTNKSISTVSDHVRKIGQGEAGQKLEVIVTDADGSGYNLDGKTLEFSENKEGGKIVSDDDQNHFEIKDAKAGRFVYTLAPAVYAASGVAWFDITSADGSVIDTTKNFNIDVIEDESIHINNDNYVSSLASFETHYDGVIKKAKEDSEALLTKIDGQLSQALADNNKKAADSLTDQKAQLQKLIDSTNQLQTDWNAQFTQQKQSLSDVDASWQTQSKKIQDDANSKIAEIESNADTQKNAIQQAADDQLKKINENANSEIDKLKQDADGQLKTNQENATAALTKINQDAADQLKSNQTANDAEINSVKQQLSDELAKVETDKTVAIQGVTDARDKAISDATDKLTAKLQSVQADYDSWKTSTVSDFQAQIDKLSKELTDDEADQASLRQVIDSAKEAVSKLHDVDFTVYAHKSDLENYYTKAETDAKLAEAGKVKTVNNIEPVDGNITIPTPDLSGLETKADAKTANDTLDKKISDNTVAIRKNSDDIATKANLADVYTKTELDPKIASAGKVKTVNNVQPDSSGNIAISMPDISGKADKTDVNNWSNRITALEVEIADLKKSGTKLVAVTQAQYDALKDKDPNVIYAIGG